MDYHICRGRDTEELEGAVQKYLDKGYVPTGGLIPVALMGGVAGWYQAVIKK